MFLSGVTMLVFILPISATLSWSLSCCALWLIVVLSIPLKVSMHTPTASLLKLRAMVIFGVRARIWTTNWNLQLVSYELDDLPILVKKNSFAMKTSLCLKLLDASCVLFLPLSEFLFSWFLFNSATRVHSSSRSGYGHYLSGQVWYG